MFKYTVSACLFLLAAGICFVTSAFAQSITSGNVTGTITDPSGSAVPGVALSLMNSGTGVTQGATTDSRGTFRFAFTAPGTYTLKVSASGFQPQTRENVVVTAGQPTAANFQLSIASASATVQVTETSGVLQTENADVTTNFNSQQIATLPNPGADLTYYAQTAPGVTMNTQGGYGNFSANGMPATSNLFSINGMNFNDPYLNLNNSGASNLMLGSNDIAEANVINNAYSGQYGQYAGSQVSYVTKSGTNQFHGNAVYLWNGRALNANLYNLNATGQPQAPFDNFNQWQTGAQGPIWKDHTFFAVDYEGVRVALPSNPVPALIPSPQFESATLANLARNGNSGEIPFYQSMFKVFNGAPGAAGAPAVASNGGCGSNSPTDFGMAAGTPCALAITSSVGNQARETLWSARVDHVFNDKDRGYIRIARDNGFQPTYTDVFNPIFNTSSNQPQMSAQISESHAFGPTAVNQFNASTLFYAAAFNPTNPIGATAALPFPVAFAGSFFGVPQSVQPQGNAVVGGEGYDAPQGRRVWQYQIIDDFSKIAGAHTFRAGFSWLHDSVTELGFGEELNGLLTIGSLGEFYNGAGPASNLQQHFTSATEAPFNFNTFGGYIADDWKVKDTLTVSLNLRLENYQNPTCAQNCFSRLANPFTNGGDVNQPYNQAILTGQHSAFPDTQAVVWEPRVGVAWNPNHGKTVIRTGFGVFADELPGQLAQAAAFNPPGLLEVSVGGSSLPGGSGTFVPGVPGNLFAAASATNSAFRTALANGQTYGQLTAANPNFTPPTITGFPSKFLQPTYYKWNFELQREIGWHMVLDLNYSGMHGDHIAIDDNGLNGYCPASTCPGGFAGLPATVPDARFGLVNQYLSAGVASYNGLSVSLQRRLSSVLTWTLNYTWSHTLDEASSPTLEPFSTGSNLSLLYPQNPHNIAANYGNSDQDVRHYLSSGFVLNDLFHHVGMNWGPTKRVLGGWTLSSNIFWRSGLPYTIVDNATSATLFGDNYGGTLFGTQIAPANANCGNSWNTPCYTNAQFVASGSNLNGFGTLGRNSFRGPGFFDMDLSLLKDVKLGEHVVFSFGAQAFNLLNHPNFDQPVGDLSNSSQFGYSTRLVGPPTSILGAFVGSADSPRFLEIKGTLRF